MFTSLIIYQCLLRPRNRTPIPYISLSPESSTGDGMTLVLSDYFLNGIQGKRMMAFKGTAGSQT